MNDRERAELALRDAGFVPKEARNSLYKGDWLRRHGLYCDSAELYGDGGCTVMLHGPQSELPALLSIHTPSLSISQVEKAVRDAVKDIDWFEADADSLVQDIMARLSSTEKEATTP